MAKTTVEMGWTRAWISAVRIWPLLVFCVTVNVPFFCASKAAFWIIWVYTPAKCDATIINWPIIKMQSCFNILLHICGKQSFNWIVMKCQWDIDDIALFLIMANAIKHNTYFSELDKQNWTSKCVLCITGPTWPTQSGIQTGVSVMGGLLFLDCLLRPGEWGLHAQRLLP